MPVCKQLGDCLLERGEIRAPCCCSLQLIPSLIESFLLFIYSVLPGGISARRPHRFCPDLLKHESKV